MPNVHTALVSPLLSNIVLNELDWWVASQWENIPTETDYIKRIYPNGTPDKSRQVYHLRKTKLKECYIVRYADDFKIFCRKRADAVKMFEATKLWLKDRLGLEISPEKSKIVNLKRHCSDFLGVKLKVREKGKSKDGKLYEKRSILFLFDLFHGDLLPKAHLRGKPLSYFFCSF